MSFFISGIESNIQQKNISEIYMNLPNISEPSGTQNFIISENTGEKMKFEPLKITGFILNK